MIDRILQGSNPTIKATVTSGSTPINPTPDQATVQIMRADGTVLVMETTATDTGVGTFTYQLTGAHTALLDTLVARWKFIYNGVVQALYTYHEIVGGFLMPLSLLAALYPDKTDDELAERRTVLESRLEDALGYAAVPRYNREVVIPANYNVFLSWKYLRQLREIKDETTGTSWDTETIAGVQFNPFMSKLYWIPSYCIPGQRTTVGYEHGEDYPSPSIGRAMELLAAEMYGTTDGAVDARVVRREADGQAITYASPSLNGGQFSTPELNSIVNGGKGILIR